MSWSLEVHIPKGSPLDKLNELFDAAEINGNDDCPEERAKAVNFAKMTVTHAICDGAFGYIDNCGFTIRANGHCNPNNEPRSGWADDYTIININQTAE